MTRRTLTITAPLVIIAGGFLMPGHAIASGGGESGGDTEILTALLLIACIVVGYILAHSVVQRIQRRFLIVTGIEYLLLGWAIGPHCGLIPSFDRENFTALLPILALAAGWFGLLRGTEGRLKHFIQVTSETWQISAARQLATGGVVLAGAYWALTSAGIAELSSVTHEEASIAAWVLGCTAAAGSAPLGLLRSLYRFQGKLHERLGDLNRIGDICVILCFGGLFCFYHPHAEGLSLSGTEWLVVSLCLGGGLGLLFTFFLGENESENVRFLALVGIISFASGAAFFLEISPLAVNLGLGLVLVNTARSGPSVHETLIRTQRPMYLVLLIFAGAMWSPPPLLAFVSLLAGFVALRLLSQALGSRIGTVGTALRRDLFRAFASHGEIAVAMALSFKLVYSGVAADLAYSVILGSVVLHDLAAPRLLRALLVDQDEISGQATETETETQPTRIA